MLGADAGTHDRLLFLGPAQPPLACPLAPTGGDALSKKSLLDVNICCVNLRTCIKLH